MIKSKGKLSVEYTIIKKEGVKNVESKPITKTSNEKKQ